MYPLLLKTIFGRGRSRSSASSLEDRLLTIDCGPALARRLALAASQARVPEAALRTQFKAILAPQRAVPAGASSEGGALAIRAGLAPFVVLLAGANGSGKTTLAGKLAFYFAQRGKRVVLAACDSFRPGAVEQLEKWSRRANAHFVRGKPQGDPAAIAYQACQTARRDQMDVVLIDTAGRLHHRADLMAELEKLVRVVRKIDPAFPHACWMVTEAAAGQNSVSQVQVFSQHIPVTGLVLSKLDGSGKGGIVLRLAAHFGLPVVGLSLGENLEDFVPFEPEAFMDTLLEAL